MDFFGFGCKIQVKGRCAHGRGQRWNEVVITACVLIQCTTFIQSGAFSDFVGCLTNNMRHRDWYVFTEL